MYDTDEEQIEALKKWWNKNGNFVITAIVLFLVLYFGISYYQSSTLKTKEAASDIYQELVELTNTNALSEVDKAEAGALIATLKSEFSDSTYAVFAALQSAKFAVDEDDLETAKTELQWALDAKPDEGLDAVVRKRLARVTFALGDAEGALALLNVEEVGAYEASYEEIKGDIYFAQGDKDSARAAYQKALDAARTNNFNRPVLEMKLDNLAVAN